MKSKHKFFVLTLSIVLVLAVFLVAMDTVKEAQAGELYHQYLPVVMENLKPNRHGCDISPCIWNPWNPEPWANP